ncbi:ankyrin [Auriscalpium vulgare]|uniref:Ankyrin n=1 Tax=Auriscalpium vulgare TaxID=40419 RepID=A0ACB8RBW4_9AGAM|nr:ankyrin [Auriscalpium vulgare]
MSTIMGDGGFALTPRMRQLVDYGATTGFLTTKCGGQELKNIYRTQGYNFQAQLLGDFALSCYVGALVNVKHAVENGAAPPLDGTETPFKFGYAALVIVGSQRTIPVHPLSCKHVETLKYLLTHGCPPDVEDICRYTALDHATMLHYTNPAILRTLLEHGAAPNHQNIYGMTPLAGAILSGFAAAVDLLMEFGADLDIPDADGATLASIYVSSGPEIAAAVRKWLRVRAGETAPRESKACAACGKTQTSLKQCGACHSVLYCTAACQKTHWRTHKPSCQSFSTENVVVFKPMYIDSASIVPSAPVIRAVTGWREPPTENDTRGLCGQPKRYPKSLVVKVQVPDGTGDLLIYSKKREFLCYVTRGSGAAAYDRVAEVVRAKGAVAGPGQGGSKGYFAAELKSADKLVVKVSELLADQPF